MAADALRQRLRRRYELARLGGALSATALVLPLLALTAMLSPRPLAGWAGAGLAWAVAAAALWRGASWGRGVVPGLIASLIPLATAHAAARVGHVCTPNGGCMSLCAPLCAAGGVAAGLILGRMIRREAHASAAFASGALLVLFVGSTGCTCVGLGGVGGIAAGLLVGGIRTVLMRGAPAAG